MREQMVKQSEKVKQFVAMVEKVQDDEGISKDERMQLNSDIYCGVLDNLKVYLKAGLV